MSLPFLTGLLKQKTDQWKLRNPNKKPFVIIKIVEWNDKYRIKSFPKNKGNKSPNNDFEEIKYDSDDDDIPRLKDVSVPMTITTSEVDIRMSKRNKENRVVIKKEIKELDISNEEVAGTIDLIDGPTDILNEYTIKLDTDHYSIDCYQHLLTQDEFRHPEAMDQLNLNCNRSHIEFKVFDTPSNQIVLKESFPKSPYSEYTIIQEVENLNDLTDKLDTIKAFNTDVVLGSGNFGMVTMSLTSDTVLACKRPVDERTEIQGVNKSLIISSPLRCLGYNEGRFYYPFQKLVSEEQFWYNLKSDIMKLRRLRLSHGDVHMGNISFSGHLIDNGLISDINTKPKTLHTFVKSQMINEVLDPYLDERCISALDKNLYNLKSEEYKMCVQNVVDNLPFSWKSKHIKSVLAIQLIFCIVALIISTIRFSYEVVWIPILIFLFLIFIKPINNWAINITPHKNIFLDSGSCVNVVKWLLHNTPYKIDNWFIIFKRQKMKVVRK
jgi:hypothetical protein